MLVETQDETESLETESFETIEDEVKHTMVSTNKKEEAAENLIFDLVDEEDAAIFENLPKKKKKDILKKVGKLMEKNEKKGAGEDYFLEAMLPLIIQMIQASVPVAVHGAVGAASMIGKMMTG